MKVKLFLLMIALFGVSFTGSSQSTPDAAPTPLVAGTPIAVLPKHLSGRWSAIYSNFREAGNKWSLEITEQTAEGKIKALVSYWTPAGNCNAEKSSAEGTYDGVTLSFAGVLGRCHGSFTLKKGESHTFEGTYVIEGLGTTLVDSGARRTAYLDAEK